MKRFRNEEALREIILIYLLIISLPILCAGLIVIVNDTIIRIIIGVIFTMLFIGVILTLFLYDFSYIDIYIDGDKLIGRKKIPFLRDGEQIDISNTNRIYIAGSPNISPNATSPLITENNLFIVNEDRYQRLKCSKSLSQYIFDNWRKKCQIKVAICLKVFF